LYESGNEDDITNENNTIESINENIQQKELEDLQRENQTLKQMVENRNQELKKESPEDKIQTLATVLGINKINERLDELNKNDNYLVAVFFSEVLMKLDILLPVSKSSIKDSTIR